MTSPHVEPQGDTQGVLDAVLGYVNAWPAHSIERASQASRGLCETVIATVGHHDEPEVKQLLAELLELVSSTAADALAPLVQRDGEGRGNG